MTKKNEGLSKVVVSSSSYDLLSNIIAKIGGMVFTIFILSRLLGPELFGIYALAFSIISIFLTFTDFGVGSAASRYISEEIGKNNIKKARSYFSYFLKLKSIMAFIAIIILIIFAYPLSYYIYEKPLLFYPLIFSCFYIFLSSLSSLPQTYLYAYKDLRKIPKIQVVEQAGKIFFSLGAILIFSYNFHVPGIYLALAVSSLLVLLYSFLIVLKKNRRLFFGEKVKIQTPRILKYTGYMGLATTSLMIFGSIDILMLGKFVDASFLAYYKLALTLSLSVGAIISGRAILLPIFTQIGKKRLQRAFEKSIRYLLLISIPSTVGLILISKTFLTVFFPSDTNYILTMIPLYALAPLIITASLISIYKPLFQAREKPKPLALSSLLSILINIILNYFLITYFLKFGQVYALLGAAIATLISRTFLLAVLAISAKKNFEISFLKRKDVFLKPLFASLVMALAVYWITFVPLSNILIFVAQIIVGMVVYILVIYSIGGLTSEDLKLIKFIPHPELLKN